MKNKFFNIKSVAVILSVLLISLSSCEGDWIDGEINNDPDSPSDVPMSLLLPGTQLAMGYNLMGNNTVRTNNIWMQQFDGVSRQSYTEARYQLTPADVNNVWISVYSDMLSNLDILVEKSKSESSMSPNYTGVAQVLQSTALGVTTDLFGAVPFSNAFQGTSGNLTPTYDEQEVVYDTIFNMLDSAVGNLASTDNVFEVGSDDVIYSGDMSKWTKASYSIKARHSLQLSNQLGNEAFRMALEAIENGFTSNADDFLIPFEDANPNPIWQFMDQRTDIRMASTFIDMLKSNNDPRLPFYAEEDANGEYTGSEPGSQNESASAPGVDVAGKSASVKLMTYSELMFIKAESHFRLGETSDAQDAYEDAIEASMLRVTGDSQSDWVAANAGPATLQNILMQKYIDSFGTNQAYADWRRTGIPSLDLAQDAVLSQIPTRFPYAQSELDYNRENVPTVTITDKVWWDQ